MYGWLKENLFFNPFYELGLEGFIELLILVFLQLAHQKSSKSGDISAIVFCFMIVGILLILFFGTVKMVLTPKEKWQNDPILMKAGELYIV